MVVEETRVPRCLADVGIKDGKNAEIGRFKGNDARKVIDAKGLFVALGFVALHTRNDAQLHRDPYLGISSWHGVTSLTIGNCGFAPLGQKDADRAMLGFVAHGGGAARTDAGIDKGRLENLPSIYRAVLANAAGSKRLTSLPDFVRQRM